MAKEFVRIVLKSGKDQSLKRFHPWVFSGAIKEMSGTPVEGDLVKVYSNQDEFLGIVITSYSIHYTKLYDLLRLSKIMPLPTPGLHWKYSKIFQKTRYDKRVCQDCIRNNFV